MAAGPIVIHLLNRRRYKVLEWAAMDFLLEAFKRSRRILHLRDLVLLALRTACLLLFGLALARPFFTAIGPADPQQPVHGVILIDNSLSMSYQQLEGTLLDQAKQRARQWIERLPPGSRWSVIPLCGSQSVGGLDAWANKDDALEALAGIETVDRAARAATAIELAAEACRRVPDLPRKQIVLVADTQLLSTPIESLAAQLDRLPAPIETIQVAPEAIENAWVADFRLQDGIADPQTPAQFLATIRYQGPQPRRDVRVTLAVEGKTLATQSIDLLPGQTREIRFPAARLDLAVEPGRPRYVTAELSIGKDRLPGDDARVLVFPLVASVDVLFVDQLGPQENPKKNLLGESWSLRRLLAPVTDTSDGERNLIRVRHTTIDRLDRQTLSDARLVIVSGVADPGPAAELLREYVVQGGPLLITAGGAFDPQAWNRSAWRDGLGLLPAPLRPGFIGRSPDEPGGPLKPFQLSFPTLVHDYFLVEQTSREELQDLYAQAWFFKAVSLDLDEKTTSAAVSNVAGSIQAERSRPRVLAAFNNGVPFLVEQRIGAGRVLFVSSGVSLAWTSISLTNAMLVFDRLARDLIQRTFPDRQMSTEQSRVIPIPGSERTARFELRSRTGVQRSLLVENLAPDRYGVAVDRVSPRGLYELAALSRDLRVAQPPSAVSGESAQPRAAVPPSSQADRASSSETKAWSATLAVNGPAEESELVPPDAAKGSSASKGLWWTKTMTSTVDASAFGGRDLWKWLLAAVLLALLAELAILAWPSLRGGTAA